MKLKNILSTSGVLLLVFTNQVNAGGGIGGSGPPAKEALEQLMSVSDLNIARVYQNGEGLGLGVKGPLLSDLRITRSSAVPMSLTVSETDFVMMADRKGMIEASNTDGLMKSYKIEDGDSLDSLILKDRREAIRLGRKDLDQVSATTN
jgi:hypothetical protein